MILLIDPLARPVLLAFIAEHVERSGGVQFVVTNTFGMSLIHMQS